MALPDTNSGVGHSFGLEIDGIVIKGISEVNGLAFEQEVVEYKENNPADGKLYIHKQPGVKKVPDITLTRGLSADGGFDKWIKDSRFGKMEDVRKGGAIIIYDYQGAPLKRYNLVNAWPKKLELSSLKAGDTSALTEKLTLTCEDFEAE